MKARQLPNLPPGFVSSEAILDGNVPSGSFTNVCGLVTDYRAPVETKRSDWKCQIRLFDHAFQYDSETALSLNLFAAKEDMPEAKCGDVIVVLQAKVMVVYGSGAPSLCSNKATKIHIYKGDDIPKPPKDASIALKASPSARWTSTPSHVETQFVSSFYHSISKERLPEAWEAEKMVEESRSIRDKKCELKDVRDGIFCDFVAEIVRDPFLEGDRLTLWVSDYTKNDRFFLLTYGATGAGTGQVGGPNGCATRFSHLEERQSHKGPPYGQLSMQVTCWGRHAQVVQDRGLKAGDWVLLLNVRIKFGNNGTNLEGCLHENPRFEDRLRLIPLHVEKDLDQLKDAFTRKRAYQKAIKQERRALEAAVAEGKRRNAGIGDDADSGGTKKKKLSAKARRQQKRSKRLGREEAAALQPPLDLNVQVRCENANATPCNFAKILAPVCRQVEIGGESISMPLPFLNVKFINDVSVTDFAPPDLKDFARPVKANVDVDALSSDDDQSSLSSSSQDGMDALQGPSSRTVYEWRFFLELEDAAVPHGHEKKRCWVLVDNEAAQCLTNLNAANLHRDSDQLQALREQLFILWGNLEEHKAVMLKARDLDCPPAHSDDEAQAEESKVVPLTRRPFRCCIRQFGVRVREADAERADAGRKKRWERLFGLFETRIAAP